MTKRLPEKLLCILLMLIGAISTIQSQDELLNNFYVSYDQNISNADFIQVHFPKSSLLLIMWLTFI